MSESRRITGIAAAACVGCCAGPIVAWAAAVGLTGGLLFGLLGVVLTAAAAVIVLFGRRQRARATAIAPVPVELTRRAQ